MLVKFITNSRNLYLICVIQWFLDMICSVIVLIFVCQSQREKKHKLRVNFKYLEPRKDIDENFW